MNILISGMMALLLSFPGNSGAAVSNESPATGPERSSRPLSDREPSRADTVWFGYYEMIGGLPYAVEGETWTFDHPGAELDLEGWTAISHRQQVNPPDSPLWGRVTAESFECPEHAPMILGTTGQLWLGKQQSFADEACWSCDAGQSCSLGYGNDWWQRVESSELAWSGGNISVQLQYFSDCEGDPYDYTSVQIVPLPIGVPIDMGRLAGIVGSPATPETFTGTVPAGSLPAGTRAFMLRFEFVSDGGWSDEGEACSTYGPCGIDNVGITVGGGAPMVYDFDDGAQGWTASVHPMTPALAGVHPISDYGDPLAECGFGGNLLALHDPEGRHPEGTHGQYEMVVSPIVDRSIYPPGVWNRLFATGRQFVDLPRNDGAFWRPGWLYYPWTCVSTGEVGWSPRVGPDAWWYTEPGSCMDLLESAQQYVPASARQVRFVIEVYSCCECFGIPSCSGESDPSPFFDNIRVGLTATNQADVGDDRSPSGAASLVVGRNPARPGESVGIFYTLPQAGPARLEVLDVAGRIVSRLVDAPGTAGPHALSWGGTDASGRAVPAGMYLVRLSTGPAKQTVKLIVLE